MAKTTKHCILICNSPPYSVQTVESQTYFGLMIDQLAALMAEKQINFSIFSPRKMSFLYKLYEDAGGDLSQALNKNYAKDKRHLVLLRGFQLQERPLSPQMGSQSTSIVEQKVSQNSPLPMSQMTGIKRPLSPSLQSTAIASSAPNVSSTTNTGLSQMHNSGPQMMPRMPHSNIGNTDIQSPFPQTSKTPTPDTVVKQGRGSPAPNPTWAQSTAPTMTSVSVSSSSPTPAMSVLKGQLNMRPIRPGVPQQMVPSNLQHQTGLQQSAPTLVSLVSQPPQPIKQNAQIRPGPQQRSQQPVPSPFSAPTPSPSQPQPSPLSIQRAVPSPIMASQSVPSPMQSTPQQIQTTQQPFSQPVNQMNASQPGFGGPPQGMQQPVKEQRRRIWAGIIEYQEKPVQPGPINAANRITYTLGCQISCHVVNGEPEINADKWPDKLVLSLLPKQLIMRLFPMLKNGSYHISLHFGNDNDQGLSKLSKIMSTNWVSIESSIYCFKSIFHL